MARPNQFPFAGGPGPIEDADGKPTSLKQLLRKQVDVTGPSMLVATLKKEGMSADEAEKRAGEILGESRPATHFIIDDANVYSVKPLLMFDATDITDRGISLGGTWLAACGGVEVTIVIAEDTCGRSPGRLSAATETSL